MYCGESLTVGNTAEQPRYVVREPNERDSDTFLLWVETTAETDC